SIPCRTDVQHRTAAQRYGITPANLTPPVVAVEPERNFLDSLGEFVVKAEAVALEFQPAAGTHYAKGPHLPSIIMWPASTCQTTCRPRRRNISAGYNSKPTAARTRFALMNPRSGNCSDFSPATATPSRALICVTKTCARTSAISPRD